MARVNVSVPAEMKERMDALGDRVNWSEAARSAFEREIATATMPADPNLDQVVERLRTSKAEFDREYVIRGREAGRNWAKQTATYKDLRAIGGFTPMTGEGLYCHQLDRALKKPNWDRGDWYEGSGNPSDEYVEAFVEGAKDVWREVADKI
jgi:hypothetical protein